jgi:peptidoglycan-associated lipoprotein
MERVRSVVLIGALAGIAATGGCSHHPAEVQPAPTPHQTSEFKTAANRPNADSMAAARRAEEERLANERAAHTAARLREILSLKVHFDYDKSELRSTELPVLAQKAAVLTANPGTRIRIAGNADERGSDEYNLVLGNQRAEAAKRYLVEQGIDAGRIEIISYGEERPLDAEHNDQAWAQNRRDDFELVLGNLTTMPASVR